MLISFAYRINKFLRRLTWIKTLINCCLIIFFTFFLQCQWAYDPLSRGKTIFVAWKYAPPPFFFSTTGLRFSRRLIVNWCVIKILQNVCKASEQWAKAISNSEGCPVAVHHIILSPFITLLVENGHRIFNPAPHWSPPQNYGLIGYGDDASLMRPVDWLNPHDVISEGMVNCHGG